MKMVSRRTFTLEKTRQVFIDGISQVIAAKQEFMADFHVNMQDYDHKKFLQLVELQNAGFDQWLATLRNILRKNISKHLLREEIDKNLNNPSQILMDYDEYFLRDLYYGLPNADLGNFIRAISEAASPETEITLDVTSLIYGGYYQENEKIC